MRRSACLGHVCHDAEVVDVEVVDRAVVSRPVAGRWGEERTIIRMGMGSKRPWGVSLSNSPRGSDESSPIAGEVL